MDKKLKVSYESKMDVWCWPEFDIPKKDGLRKTYKKRVKKGSGKGSRTSNSENIEESLITKPNSKGESEKKIAHLEEMLAPLDEVILAPEVIDEVVMKTAIPDLIMDNEPHYNGVILHGPPGTGKTILLEAIAKVYENAGSCSFEGNLAQMTTHYVGDLARNLDNFFLDAVSSAKNLRKPVFAWIDEGSAMAQKADLGSSSVSKYYQEAIDVIKKYVGNYRELIIGISTNNDPKIFEDALIRSGRLTTIKIDQPGINEKKRLWKHFLKKEKVIEELDDLQYQKLTESIPYENGAFIEEFCRCYTANKMSDLMKKESGKSTIIGALKAGKRINDDELHSQISYRELLDDIKDTVAKKYRDRESDKENRNSIGFI